MYRILCDSYVIYDPRLPDLFVLEPTLTQKKNEPGELTFTIPKEHPHYGVVEKLKSRVKVYRDDTLIWVGRVIEDERDLYENRKVVVEGALALLLDSILRPLAMDGTTSKVWAYILTQHSAQLIENQRFAIGNCDVAGSVSIATKDYLPVWQILKTGLLDPLGGFLIVRFDEYENPILDYLADVPDTSTQRIEFGENLIDLAVTGVISSVNIKNTRVLKIGYKRKSETYYTDTTFTLSAYAVNGNYRIGGSLSNQYTYDIRVTLGDFFGEAYGYTDLSTAEVILSVRSTGMGLAVGKVAEEDSFDVGWPARFRENVQFDKNVVFSSVLWLANLIFPVGSIRMTVSAADESAFLGGTWMRWGTGRVPVGVNTSDMNFNTVEKTGGANTHTLATAELPSHNHSFSGSVTVNANGAHTHQASSGSYKVGSGSASTYYYMTNGGSTSGQTTGSGGSHDHTGSVSGSVGSNGSGAAHNNLQPYITCYFWKRTA